MSWLEDIFNNLNRQSSNGDDGGGLMVDPNESLFVGGGYDAQWEHWKQMNRA